MTRPLMMSAATFGVAALTAVIVAVFTHVARSLDYEWSSLTGPEPIRLAVVGFGSMTLWRVSAARIVGLFLPRRSVSSSDGR